MSTPEENANHHSVLETPDDADQNTILETPQMNMNQGIKMFGTAGVEVVKQEMQQLHDKGVMKSREARSTGLFNVFKKKARWNN